MLDFTLIGKFDLSKEFTTKNGKRVKLIGTCTLPVQKNSNGYCGCLRSYKDSSGRCLNCFLNNTIDLITVNGVNVTGGYRRGTVLKMAGMQNAELWLVCHDDSVVPQNVIDEILFGK